MDKKAIICSQFVDYTKLTLLDLDMLNTTLFVKTVLYVLNELTVVYSGSLLQKAPCFKDYIVSTVLIPFQAIIMKCYNILVVLKTMKCMLKGCSWSHN